MRISDWSSDVCSSDLYDCFEALPLKGRASKPRFKAPRTDAMKTTLQTADQLNLDWSNNPRWNGVTRSYCADDVVRLRGTVHVEHSLAKLGAEKLWKSLHNEPFVNALGALTGNQAMQQVKAGLKAIYLSGWQVAADAERKSGGEGKRGTGRG